jgi:hypothetical protein
MVPDESMNWYTPGLSGRVDTTDFILSVSFNALYPEGCDSLYRGKFNKKNDVVDRRFITKELAICRLNSRVNAVE